MYGCSGEKDVVTESIRIARLILDQHQFQVISATTDYGSLDVLRPVLNTTGDHLYNFEKGWAIQYNMGCKYGRKYIEPFKQDVDDMFQAGIENSAARKDPGRMLAELQRRYPGRLDLPSEQEIRERITALTAKQKKGQSAISTVKRGIADPFMSTILEIFRKNPTVTPRVAWAQFIEVHPPQNEYTVPYPDQSKVKNKFSALKAKNKTRQQLDV